MLRKKELLKRIETIDCEIIALKRRIVELEAQNTQKIKLNIDRKEVGRIIFASTEPLASFNSEGLKVKGKLENN